MGGFLRAVNPLDDFSRFGYASKHKDTQSNPEREANLRADEQCF